MLRHTAVVAASTLLLSTLACSHSDASPPTTGTRAASADTGSSASPSTTSPAAADPSANPAAAKSTTPYADWPTYHGGGTRSGYAITAKHVTTTPDSVWSIPLDGAVYGQPIVVDHGIKIAVTENNSVYRLSGNSVVWRKNLGTPVPKSSLPCGDIDPTGITSTTAYDASTNTVVVVSLLNSPIRHVATGFDPVNGAVKWSRTVDVPASVTGVSPTAMQQRGALLVSGRRVYVPYGGLAGDCSTYRGSVVGLDLDHPTTASLWDFTSPGSRQGGIWSAPGPVENPDGGLFVVSANGSTGSSKPYDYTNSVLRIANQHIQDSFAPTTWREDNINDVGLGSQNAQIVGKYIFIGGKSETAYVLNRSKLGGIGGEVSQMSLCRSYGGAATVGNVVYVPCVDGVRAVRINSDGTMTVLWHAESNINGTPTVGGGLIWAMDYSGGTLHALSPATGASVYSLSTGTTNRFVAPAVYGNAVFVGTLTGVRAFNW